VTTKLKRYDLRRSPAAPKATENSEQDDSPNRRNKDRGEVEPFSVLEAQKTADEEAADKRSDDADDQIGQQSVITAGNPFGQPASQDTNDDAGYDAQKQPPVRVCDKRLCSRPVPCSFSCRLCGVNSQSDKA